LSTINIAELVADCMTNNDWKSIENFFNQSDFASTLGIRVILDDPEQPKCEIANVQRLHLGGVGQVYVNGAVLSAVLDFALGLTGLQYAEMGHFATCSLNIDLARPVEKDGFYAVAKCNKKIGNKLFSEATIYDANDEPCVYATGMLRVGIR